MPELVQNAWASCTLKLPLQRQRKQECKHAAEGPGAGGARRGVSSSVAAGSLAACFGPARSFHHLDIWRACCRELADVTGLLPSASCDAEGAERSCSPCSPPAFNHAGSLRSSRP